MFSIARSNLALPVQLLFLVFNGLGVGAGTMYNISTPDLYENNVHHSIGWIATWVMTAQTIMSLLFVYAGRTMKMEPALSAERESFLPPTMQALCNLEGQSYHKYRWSGDSGHGTDLSSPSRESRDLSPTESEVGFHSPKPEADFGHDDGASDMDDDAEMTQLSPLGKSSFLRFNPFDRLPSAKIPKLLSSKALFVFEVAYEVVDRTILILGFVALLTGGVTYTGIFVSPHLPLPTCYTHTDLAQRSKNVFSGLAHFIKGGIFFWYGLLTLSRWMGCFADFGWAWNVKPTRSEVGQWKTRVPTAEFVESFLIFFYGASNVFLEHLAAWGQAWTAEDFEHVSISVMFFGGGLFGMLVESTTVRRWLNTSIDVMPVRTEVHPSVAQEVRREPKTYNFSMNVVPGLIVLLLGIMMSSHHQSTMVSTKVHAMWGNLFAGAALARGLTYIIMWLKPPTSVYPSRPPTELLTAFCLISGGMVFMSSAKDIMWWADHYGLMAMFLFTVTMGFTAFLMGYEILVLALKGWAVRRQSMRFRQL